MKQDVYQKVTDMIIADLEKGELTWLKPWSASNMDGRITKPRRNVSTTLRQFFTANGLPDRRFHRPTVFVVERQLPIDVAGVRLCSVMTRVSYFPDAR